MTKKREVERVFLSSKEQRTAGRAAPADVSLGIVIRRRRLAIGITQEQLGEQIGVSYQQAQKYETGANRVSFSRLLPLAAALNCSAADLVMEAEAELRAVSANSEMTH